MVVRGGTCEHTCEFMYAPSLWQKIPLTCGNIFLSKRNNAMRLHIICLQSCAVVCEICVTYNTKNAPTVTHVESNDAQFTSDKPAGGINPIITCPSTDVLAVFWQLALTLATPSNFAQKSEMP